MLQPTHVVSGIPVRKHLCNVIRCTAAGIVKFYPCISRSCLPQPSHIFRSRHVLVLEQSEAVQGDLMAGIA